MKTALVFIREGFWAAFWLSSVVACDQVFFYHSSFFRSSGFFLPLIIPGCCGGSSSAKQCAAAAAAQQQQHCTNNCDSVESSTATASHESKLSFGIDIEAAAAHCQHRQDFF
jgi:hypothetical protein